MNCLRRHKLLGVFIARPLACSSRPQPFPSAVRPVRSFHASRLRLEIVQFHLSDIGEGIKEVTIKEWFVKPGDEIHQFDQICEVQSDKASVTITSRYDGIIKKLHFQLEEVAQTGDALVDIETGEGCAISAASDPVEVNELQDSEAINVGGHVGSSNLMSVKSLATPAVRRIAAEYQVNLTDILGTGKDGRVLKEDILAYIESKSSPQPRPVEHPAVAARPAAQAASGSAAVGDAATLRRPLPQAAAAVPIGQDRTEPLKGIQKVMGKTMTAALSIPHFGYCDELDMSLLVTLRQKLKPELEARGLKMSYLPFFIKACSMALLQYPVLNCHFDAASETLTYKAQHNIGIAMDTAQGLLVPVIKNVQGLSIVDIGAELLRLQDLGMRNKLGENELRGGTFALSNIGSIGGTYAKPVIMPPQVAIGALGRIQTLPRFDSAGQVVKAHVMSVSWSADHRVLDGASVARFSNVIKNYIEDPFKMCLDLR